MSVGAAAVLVVAGALTSACGGSLPSHPLASTDLATKPYRTDVPGLESRLFLPSPAPQAGDAVPVIVLVPGGGWESADPSGLVPLAEALASSGSAVLTTTYRTAKEDAIFPVPLKDVVCAVDDAAQRVADEGLTTSSVVVVGHSAGAQLAALAALVGEDYQSGCASPPTAIDGLVGLAGPYDILAFDFLASSLFGVGPAEQPETWAAGNPLVQAAQRPELPVLLLHGTTDDVVDPENSRLFADELEEVGHPVTLLLLPGLDHAAVYAADTAAAPIEEFVAGLRPTG
jgi:acetyl esterase/lipase